MPPPLRPREVAIWPGLEPQLAKLAEAADAARKPEQAIWKSYQTALTRIHRDIQWGEVIPNASIPERMRAEFAVTNLYCIDLADFHRLFYTIEDRRVVILAIVDHAEYDRLFGKT